MTFTDSEFKMSLTQEVTAVFADKKLYPFFSILDFRGRKSVLMYVYCVYELSGAVFKARWVSRIGDA